MSDIKTKMCRKCKQEKAINEFNKRKGYSKDGYRNDCKICQHYSQHKHYIKYREELKLKHNQWHSEHREQHNLQNKKRNLEHKKELKIYHKQWEIEHKNERLTNKRKYEHKRYKTNYVFRIIKNIRSRMNCALKSQGVKKSMHTIEGLGCTKEFYQNYIQSLFKPGMTKENNGKRKWVQHHPIELASVDLRNPEQQKKAFHHTNVIPMWEDEHKVLHTK